ncbi:MAG TPA: hypothetical protein VKP88_00220 [Candidatus Paceibacterota bacterium]|nr:hypothetical protein [Candidatus Paceibacterota bacterium]
MSEQQELDLTGGDHDSANVALMLDQEIDRRVGLALVRILAGGSSAVEATLELPNVTDEYAERAVLRSAIVRELLHETRMEVEASGQSAHDFQHMVKQALRTL